MIVRPRHEYQLPLPVRAWRARARKRSNSFPDMPAELSKLWEPAVRPISELRSKILDFRGFDPSRISSFRGGIPSSTGNFRKFRVNRILAWRFLLGRLAVAGPAQVLHAQGQGLPKPLRPGHSCRPQHSSWCLRNKHSSYLW